MTVTLNLSDATAQKLLASYPEEEELNRFADNLFTNALEYQQEETEDLVTVINSALADIKEGKNTYSFDEVRQMWAERDAQLEAKTQ